MVKHGRCGAGHRRLGIELVTRSIDNSANRPAASMAQANDAATMWPNPMRDGQVNLNIDGIQDAVQHINVDIQDIYGKQVFAKEFGNSGELFTTILDLPSDSPATSTW